MALSDLSDQQLVSSLHAICAEGHRWTARLVVLLIEVEERRLHLRAACSSMFDYCLRRLGMSEGAAFRRINAARLVKRFPSLLALIESGAIHLSALVLLRDHLTEANAGDLSAAACKKSKREVEQLVARHAPRPDVPCTIRKLPAAARGMASGAIPAASGLALAGVADTVAVAAAAPAVATCPNSAGAVAAPSAVAPSAVALSASSASSAVASTSHTPATAAAPPAVLPGHDVAGAVETPGAVASTAKPKSGARFESLSEARYKLSLTVSGELREKLERARDLMRHRHPDGDVGVVLAHALDALLEKLGRERLAQAKHPRKALRAGSSSRVSSAVRRAVFERDGEQCTFVDEEGGRCPSRSRLELDHIEARARGGSNDATNLRVRCRPHNVLHAENVFGRAHIAARVRSRQRPSSHTANTIPSTPAALPNAIANIGRQVSASTSSASPPSFASES